MRIDSNNQPLRTVSKLLAFVSYIHVESKFADLLKTRLVNDFIGLVDPYVATDAIPVGTAWFDNIIKCLNDADIHLIVCSPESKERPWIHFEAGEGESGFGHRGYTALP